jgi:hypothetical protein
MPGWSGLFSRKAREVGAKLLQFAAQFEDEENVVTLSRQLSWSHFLILIPLKNKDAKQYYAQATAAHKISIRALRKEIAAKTFERLSIANVQIP